MKHVPALIARKRDGAELAPEDIDALLEGYARGDVAEYQMSALLMAICFRGLTDAELDRWTARLIDSGERWEWSGVPGVRVDKHSTGGVGDKVSLVLGPVVAELGLQVPMIAGRGLGHTGGTIDKVESIPGLRTALDREDCGRLLAEVGFAIGSQTARLAPLDGELYALRDVTATVESVPLIAASIVAKKVAEGLDALVLDVKVGTGAFLPEQDAASELAERMVDLAARLGLPAEAVLTRMDEPLGSAIGNALEVREAVETLRGNGPSDVVEITAELGARMLVLADSKSDIPRARERVASVLSGGAALERFRRWVAAQGGDPRVVDEPERLPAAPVRTEALAAADGYLQSLDAREIGLLVVELGGGRTRKGDSVDPSVGVVLDRKPGDAVTRGERLATVHAANSAAGAGAARRIAALARI
ncbi:MAG: thymidine phosphorylase, partial [Gemmatimonadetes bacterium]|nr:thymidine phosphorylase [Gemmatimonadota bacterium]